jgi:tellurite resistance protein
VAETGEITLLGRLREPFAAGAQRARNKPFLEAAMAAAAFIAATDEAVGLARRHRLDGILDSVERLKGFEVHSAVSLFDETTSAISVRRRSGPRRGC